MTKRITTNKKDREKAKQQKREEKLKRKEERQSSGTSSFEDMIAYVDENGRLCTAPPEQSAKKIDATEISVSTPKQEEVEVPEFLNGRVEHFNSSKGYGFIKDIGSSEKYFFHISSAPSFIKEGDKVTFKIER